MGQRHLLGLDIGSKFVKAVQLTESSGTYKITEFGIAEISPQVSAADAVMELLARKKFKTKRVASAVSGRFVFVRYISMPVLTDEELGNAAKYELGKYIPVEVDEVLHDSQKLEELPPQEGQEPEMRVLLVASKRTFVDEHVAVLEAAGLLPSIVDVDSFALGNAYELTGMARPDSLASGKLLALVDIGASKTNINIMSDAMSHFTREFYKGGDDITDAISKRLSLEMREAELLKRNFMGDGGGGGGGGMADDASGPAPIVMVSAEDAEKLQGGTARRGETRSMPIVILERGDSEKMRRGSAPQMDQNERIQDSMSGVLDDICHDINISIDYFENQYDKKVDQVLLTGGASLTPGLVETLERAVQKPVSRWNPLQYHTIELNDASAQELQAATAQAVIALGLAARIVP